MQQITDEQTWRWILAEAGRYDFYHSYDYHALSASSDSGRPVLYVYRHQTGIIAIPLIVRDILPEAGSAKGLHDATSVYGYAGPVYSAGLNLKETVPAFQRELTAALEASGIVSVFSRLNPFTTNEQLLAGKGFVADGGVTIAIDLSQTEREQLRQYSNNHRRGIKKLLKAGVSCEMSDAAQDLDKFVKIYRDTMSRVDATEGYFFDKHYFENLLSSREFAMNLFVCRHGGEVVAGGVFSSCNGIVQYHLGGTRTENLSMAPSKLLMETVRSWACETGHRVFHLGGGLGGERDSLYAFKRGFAKNGETKNQLWKWIVDATAYRELLEARGFGADAPGSREQAEGFFPAYRRVSKE